MKKMVIGIASENAVRQRMLAIARGEFRPKPDEPKVWFASLNAVAQVLSPENIELLRVIEHQHPSTLTELAEMTHRAKSNLSKTLKTMEKYGFVELRRQGGNRLQPVAKATDFRIEMAAAV